MTGPCWTRILQLFIIIMGGWSSSAPNQSLAWAMVLPRSSLSSSSSSSYTLQRLGSAQYLDFQSASFPKNEIRQRRLQTCMFAVAATTTSIATTPASTEKHGPTPNHEVQPSSSTVTTTSGRRRYRVGIIGAGAVAFGTAAVLNDAHQDAMLWSPSGKGTQELLVNHHHVHHHHQSQGEHDNVVDTLLESTGALESTFSPRIASSCRDLVENNDVLLLAVPANGHKNLFEQVAKFIRSDQTIIISSHASFGALFLSQLLKRERPDLQSLPMIIAWGTTVCTARKAANASNAVVRLNTVRTSVDMCVLPASSTDQGLELCQQLFSSNNDKNKNKIQFQPRNGLLAIALSNVNPQNHLGIALGNISRMENKEEWFQMLNITPTIGRLLEALDQERLQIANVLNVQVKTIFEHFSLSFHVPISDSISDMGTAIYKSGNDVHGPNTADSRYVTEDVPFGLVPTTVLGKLVRRPTPLHESGVQIMSAMYGRDFFQENDLLQALRLEQYTLEELVEASQTGTLPSKTS